MGKNDRKSQHLLPRKSGAVQAILEKELMRQKIYKIRLMLWFNSRCPMPVNRWMFGAKYLLAKNIGL